MNPLRRGFIYLCSVDSKRAGSLCFEAQTVSFSLSLLLPRRGTFRTEERGRIAPLSCRLLHKGITH